MNVLYVTANPFLRSTTSSLNAIIRELMPRGVRPVMLFTTEGPWQRSLRAEGLACHVRSLVVPDGRAPLRAAAPTWNLLSLLVRERIDLVHCNEHELFPALRLAARLARVPVVVSLHWTLEPGFGHWAFRRPYSPAALQFLSRGQLCLSKDGIPPAFPPDRVKLLMSGLFIDAFLRHGGDRRTLRDAWGADEQTVVLGTATAIQPRKRLEDFVRLIARLRASGRRVLGVIAGGGMYEDAPYRLAIERVIASEQIDAHCRLIGNMDPVTPFYRAIDIAVNTSEMEILSMSMCEAMACGVPTIAYDVGGNAETVPDAWSVVPFASLDALTDRAARLVDDGDFRASMGRAAERHVRAEFDAPVLARRQEAIYEEVLGRRPHSTNAIAARHEAGA